MMNARLLVAALAAFAGSGCILTTEDDDVSAGYPLDAHFVLTWTIEDAATGAPLDCAFARADTVRIRAHNLSTGDVLIDLFDCGAGSGETYDLTAGDYTIVVDLVDCFGDPGCTAPVVISALPDREIYSVWRDVDYDLGHYVFLVR